MNDIDNDIIRISEELDVPLKKLYMLSNNRIRYHKRNQNELPQGDNTSWQRA